MKQYLAVLAILLGLTAILVALRPLFGLAAVALIYLLPVFLSAVWWGRGPSLLASLLSFLILNFFFTVPLNTFFVWSTADLISLVVFLSIAEMTARLVSKLREREAEAHRSALEAAEAQILRRTDELKSALLSAVSHDLRTPLASIRVAATGLLQDGFDTDKLGRRELLRTIDAEAARLSRLVGNLLDLSRIEAGVLKPLKEWRDLQEVVAHAIDSMGERVQDHRVVAQIPSSLPLVPLDFTHIEDVLMNLLDNAVRYSPVGTTITIRGERRGEEVVIQVENEGPAVPSESAEHIFSRFYSVQRDRRGVGLGLAICKGLVEAHGGRIWVERAGQPGARFAFALPLQDTPRPRPLPSLTRT